MPRGINNAGDFRKGNPARDSGNVVDWTVKPREFGNPINSAPSPTNFGNPITSAPNPANFGNQIGGTAPTPTFSPAAGTYGVPQDVKIIANADAIYFTLDGTNPTVASRLYVGNVFVSHSETIKAIAVTNGVVSSIGSAAYVITIT